MSDPSFEARLEAMERRLAEIQQELAPEVSVRVSPEPVPEPAPEPDPEPAPEPDPEPAPAPSGAAVEVSAGPFVSMDALREFERELSSLPGVSAVTVRGYETGNRAILEVQLKDETS